MNAFLNRLFDALEAQLPVLLVGIGMGVYRCAHEWPVWFNQTLAVASTPLLGTDGFLLVIDAGKVAGVVLYVALCYRCDRAGASGVLLTLPSAVLALGYVAPLLFGLGAPLPPSVVAASLVACGVGAGMLFSQWIEACGCLPPLRVTEALAVSYVTRALLLPVVTGCALATGGVLIILLAGSSFVQVALCRRVMGDKAGLERARTLPPRGTSGGYGALLAWACVFTFAYGLGEGVTHLSHSVLVSGAGYLLPSVLVLGLAARLRERFDRNILYAVSIPLMAAGLAGVEFFGASAALAQTLVSAGMCAFELLTYTTACMYALGNRTSSMFVGSCVRVAALVSADVATAVVRLVPPQATSALVMGATLAAVAMGFVMFLSPVAEQLERMRLRHGDGPRPSGPSPDADGRGGRRTQSEAESQASLRALAEGAGLSPRETTVFMLLVDGQTVAQVSEELFISAGAVRAHCSRIYGKLGVHTRQDFDRLVARRT